MWGSLPSVRDKYSHPCHPTHSEILLLLCLALGHECRLMTGSCWSPGRVCSPGDSWGHRAGSGQGTCPLSWGRFLCSLPCNGCSELLQPAPLPLPCPCFLPLVTFLPPHVVLRDGTSTKRYLRYFLVPLITAHSAEDTEPEWFGKGAQQGLMALPSLEMKRKQFFLCSGRE